MKRAAPKPVPIVGTRRVQVHHAAVEFDAEPAGIADLALEGNRLFRLVLLNLDLGLGLERVGVSRTHILEINTDENSGRHAGEQEASAPCFWPIHDQLPPSPPSELYGPRKNPP